MRATHSPLAAVLSSFAQTQKSSHPLRSEKSQEILAYFYCRLTNARTEGFNGKAKLVIRRAYGYKSFRNYRLRLLNSCA